MAWTKRRFRTSYSSPSNFCSLRRCEKFRLLPTLCLSKPIVSAPWYPEVDGKMVALLMRVDSCVQCGVIDYSGLLFSNPVLRPSTPRVAEYGTATWVLSRKLARPAHLACLCATPLDKRQKLPGLSVINGRNAHIYFACPCRRWRTEGIWERHWTACLQVSPWIN